MPSTQVMLVNKSGQLLIVDLIGPSGVYAVKLQPRGAYAKHGPIDRSATLTPRLINLTNRGYVRQIPVA